MINIFDNFYLDLYAWAEATGLTEEEIEKLINEKSDDSNKK
jgi:plasmid maintenance system antidote protein VapI